MILVSTTLQSTFNLIIFLFLITWLFRRHVVLHTRPLSIRFKRMISHSDVYKFDGERCAPTGPWWGSQRNPNPSRQRCNSIVQIHPHSPCLKQLSTVIIWIVTVGLEDINKDLPVNPLPPAQARFWNSPADFLQMTWEPPPHTHSWWVTSLAQRLIRVRKSEKLWVLTAWRGSRGACLALRLYMLSVNHYNDSIM